MARRTTNNERQSGEHKFWLFQAHPRGDDLREFLRDAKRGKIYSWRIPHYKYPKKHMQLGDGVVLWQARGTAPEASGVYALGSLTGDFPFRGREAGFVLEALRPLDDPIPTQIIRQRPELRDLAVLRPKGSMGPCFKLTSSQWATFVDLWGTPAEVSVKDNGVTMIRLPVEIPHVASTSVEREPISYELERREAQLVSEYENYITEKGCRPERTQFKVGDDRMVCDLFDETRKNLIEAKSSIDRASIRMAIGQLADYVRLFELRPSLAVLLPERPPDDLLALLASQRISVVWRCNEGKFEDNADGRFI